MIELKNIMEDIIFGLIDGLDESKSGEIDKNQKKEIAAFTLNRIRPMYITSNKGFTNMITKHENDPQFLADIMIQISEALKVVKKSAIVDNESIEIENDKPFYVFPKLYGKVVSASTMCPIVDVDVYLYIDSELADSIFQSWNNPVKIKNIDEGIYSFAPKPLVATPPFTTKSFLFDIVVIKGSQKHEKIFPYECTPSIITAGAMDIFENVLQVEDIYVKFKGI